MLSVQVFPWWLVLLCTSCFCALCKYVLELVHCALQSSTKIWSWDAFIQAQILTCFCTMKISLDWIKLFCFNLDVLCCLRGIHSFQRCCLKQQDSPVLPLHLLVRITHPEHFDMQTVGRNFQFPRSWEFKLKTPPLQIHKAAQRAIGAVMHYKIIQNS